MAIKIPKESTHEFVDLRNGIKACIEALNTGAIVHNNIALTADLDETIRELTDAQGKVHAWTIHISDIDVRNYRTAGAAIEFPLTVKVIGYIGNQYGTGNESRQAKLEKECKDIIKILHLNRDNFGMDNDAPLQVQDGNDAFLTFADIDVKAFGSGNDVLIAEGTITVLWTEYVQEQI